MSRIVIGLTGYAGVGKDTVADLLVEHHGFTKVSFADPLREMAKAIDPVVGVSDTEPKTLRYNDAIALFGYTEAKRLFPEIRQFLQRLGTDAVRDVLGEDTWCNHWLLKVAKMSRKNIVATDVRFDSEVMAVMRAWGVTVRVTRPGVGPVNDHVSEKGDFPVDHTIQNSGEIGDLLPLVDMLVRQLR